LLNHQNKGLDNEHHTVQGKHPMGPPYDKQREEKSPDKNVGCTKREMQAWIAGQLLVVAIGRLEEEAGFRRKKLGSCRCSLIVCGYLVVSCQAPVELILVACVDHEYLLKDLYVHQVSEHHHQEGRAPESISWTLSIRLTSDRALRSPGSDSAVRLHRGLYFLSKNGTDMGDVYFQRALFHFLKVWVWQSSPICL